MYNFAKNTFIHKLHPLVKIIIVTLTIFLVLISPGLEGGVRNLRYLVSCSVMFLDCCENKLKRVFKDN